jgi:tape measure domain-containing protein
METSDKIVIIVEHKGAKEAKQAIKDIGTESKNTSALIRSFKTEIGNTGLNQINRTLDNTARSFTGLEKAVIGFVSVRGLMKIRQIGDEFIELQNRIKLVTDTQEEYNSVYARIKNIASDTRSELLSTAMAYNRAAISTENMGLSEEKLGSVVKAVNQTLKISGATAQEAKASLIQFFQGMASGQLRGDEFRSIAEQNIRLTKILKQELAGGDMGKLRKMAYAGELSTSIVINAILKNLDTLDKEFAETIPSVGEGFIKLKSGLIDAFGKFNEATGVTSKFYKVMQILGENIGKVSILLGLIVAPYIIDGIGTMIMSFGKLATTLTTLDSAGFFSKIVSGRLYAGLMKAATGIQAMTTASLAFIATPMGATLAAIAATVTAVSFGLNKANSETERWMNMVKSDQSKMFIVGAANNKLKEVESQIDAMPFFLSGKGQQEAMSNLTDLREKLKNVIKTGSDPEGLLKGMWLGYGDRAKKEIDGVENRLKAFWGAREKIVFKTSLPMQGGQLGVSEVKDKLVVFGNITFDTYKTQYETILGLSGELNEKALIQAVLKDKDFEIMSKGATKLKDITEGEERIYKEMDKVNKEWLKLNDWQQLGLYNLMAYLHPLEKVGKATKKAADEAERYFTFFMRTKTILPELENPKLSFQVGREGIGTFEFWDNMVQGSKDAFTTIEDNYKDMTDNIQAYEVQLFDSFGTTLTDNTINMFGKIIAPDLFKNATDSWREFAHQMSTDLANLLTKMLLYKYLLAPLFDGSTGGSGISPFLSFGYESAGSIANSDPFANSIFRADGGSVNANSPYIVGERGIEMFVPNQSGTIVSNQNMQNIGGSAQVMNYIVLDSELPNIMANSKANEKATMNIIKLNANQVKQMLGI